jgi:hypothetical protein
VGKQKSVDELRNELRGAEQRWIEAKNKVDGDRARLEQVRSLLGTSETALANAGIALENARKAVDDAMGYTPPRPPMSAVVSNVPIAGMPILDPTKKFVGEVPDGSDGSDVEWDVKG